MHATDVLDGASVEELHQELVLASVMRIRPVLALALALICADAGRARAAECENDSPLGVSRIAEVDTSGGALFGGLQYIANGDFLQDREVVLTFDDGPHVEHTTSVLKSLASECTRATFFVVGRMALAYPDTLRAMARNGHTIGVHTWSHAWIGKLTPERARSEFEMAVSALPRILGRPIAPFFRFPFLSDPKTEIDYIKSRDFGIFSIDIDSYDSRGFSADRIVKHTMKWLNTKGRGIILFHDIKRTTAAALPQILRELKKGGFRVVHMVPSQRAMTVADYDAELNVAFSKRFPTKPGKDGLPGEPGAYPVPVLLADGAPVIGPASGGGAGSAPDAIVVASATTAPPVTVSSAPAGGTTGPQAPPAPPLVVAAVAPELPAPTPPELPTPVVTAALDPSPSALPGTAPVTTSAPPAAASTLDPAPSADAIVAPPEPEPTPAADVATAPAAPEAPTVVAQVPEISPPATSTPEESTAPIVVATVAPPIPLRPSVEAEPAAPARAANSTQAIATSFLSLTVSRNKRTPQVGVLRLTTAKARAANS